MPLTGCHPFLQGEREHSLIKTGLGSELSRQLLQPSVGKLAARHPETQGPVRRGGPAGGPPVPRKAEFLFLSPRFLNARTISLKKRLKKKFASTEVHPTVLNLGYKSSEKSSQRSTRFLGCLLRSARAIFRLLLNVVLSFPSWRHSISAAFGHVARSLLKMLPFSVSVKLSFLASPPSCLWMI